MNELSKLGFTLGTLLKMIWLHQGNGKSINPKLLHDYYTELFPERPVSYDYIARIGKRMENEGLLELEQVEQRKFYRTTANGLIALKHIESMYYGRFHEVLLVLNRIEQHIGKGQLPVAETQLPKEYRTFFARLISVKDIARYMVFSLGQTRTEFYIAETNEAMVHAFGWTPSSKYLYEIAREMESEGTIKGHWKDPDKRSIRLIKVTDEGVVFSKQIRESLHQQVKTYQRYLKSILDFLQ